MTKDQSGRERKVGLTSPPSQAHQTHVAVRSRSGNKRKRSKSRGLQLPG